MKRMISFFILSICLIALLLSAASCNEKPIQMTQANQASQVNKSNQDNQDNQNNQVNKSTKSIQTNSENINAFSSSPKPTGMAHLILYSPDKNFKYLVAQERYMNIEKSIEDTIVSELIKQFNPSKNVRIIAITEKAGILTVNLSGEFNQVLKIYGNKKNIILYSLVNSLTELNGVNEVRLLVGGKEISGLPSNNTPVKNNSSNLKTFKRNRSYFNRDSKLLPSEVLRKEMTYEQNGQWLKAYQLMSDDQSNKYRKYYNEYYKEMEETKANGFLSTKFKVNGYKINKIGDKASVEVQFINNINSSYAQGVDKIYFNVVKIEGVWMVDWLTTQ
jgi:hypothetical protein